MRGEILVYLCNGNNQTRIALSVKKMDTDWVIGIWFLAEAEIFRHITTLSLALEPIHLPIPWIPKTWYPRVQNVEHEVYNSPRLKTHWASTHPPIYLCGIAPRQRDITFHLTGNDMHCTYHCNENTKFWTHVDCISISEGELLLLLFVCIKNYSNLLGCHWQHWQLYAVELVKTAPWPWLCQTWKGKSNIDVNLINNW